MMPGRVIVTLVSSHPAPVPLPPSPPSPKAKRCRPAPELQAFPATCTVQCAAPAPGRGEGRQFLTMCMQNEKDKTEKCSPLSHKISLQSVCVQAFLPSVFFCSLQSLPRLKEAVFLRFVEGNGIVGSQPETGRSQGRQRRFQSPYPLPLPVCQSPHAIGEE